MFKLITSMPPFLALSIAIVFEVIATSFIPKAEQFTKLVPSTVVLVGYGVAFFLLSVTVKTMLSRYRVRDMEWRRYCTCSDD